MRKQSKESSVVDETRSAESVPLATPATQGSGKSSMAGLVTDTRLLMGPKVQFVDSPFGQRYISRKTKAIAVGDIQFRLEMWGMNAHGYNDYGTVTDPVLTGTTGAEQVLEDWYGLTRELGKRGIKYKHIPTTLTDNTVFIDQINAHMFLIGNIGVLLNLSRLPLYNSSGAIINTYIGRYMSRLTRTWRRMSAIPMVKLFKQHALRNMNPVILPGTNSVYARFWSPRILRDTDGPGDMPAGNALNGSSIWEVLNDADKLGDLVSYLETVELWCEKGSTNIMTDWLAIQDLIGMTVDVVPGVWSTGLPAIESLPGIVNYLPIVNDVLYRLVTEKDDVSVGTDQWNMFPVPDAYRYDERVPVLGLGAKNIYDFCCLGAPKFGIFNTDATLQIADVNTPCRLMGTDIRQSVDWTNPEGALDVAMSFGSTDADELAFPEGGSPAELGGVVEVNGSSATTFLKGQSLRSLHAFMEHRFAVKGGVGAGYNRFVEENPYQYIFYADAVDYGENTAQLYAEALGIPYLKSV